MVYNKSVKTLKWPVWSSVCNIAMGVVEGVDVHDTIWLGKVQYYHYQCH